MQNHPYRQPKRFSPKSLSTLALLTICLLIMTVSLVVSAQDATPTTAPTAAATSAPEAEGTPLGGDGDPATRAFRVVRDVIEEKKSIDLTYVKSFVWEQVEWRRSIDACDSEIAETDWRTVYFGWNFDITDLGGTTHFARISFDLRNVVVCDREDAGGSAPNPDGTGNPGNLPTPIPGSGATGTFEIGGHVSNLTGEADTAMKQAGMTWIKKQLRYNQGDGTGGAQGLLDIGKAGGYKVMLGIVGDKDQLAAGGDAYINQFAAFVGDVAALGVNAIEVWNEPNIDREWPAGQINGANYTKLLAASYNAIKAKNASTIVISGAPAPTGFFGAAGCAAGGCNDDAFMAQMAAAGAGSYMDCVGLHYNEGIVSPDTTSGDPRGEYPTYYFGSMTARGNLFGKPICYTELGYLSGEGFNTPIPGGFAWAQNVTVAQQAAWLATAASRAAAFGNVRLMIVWNVNFTIWNTDPQAGYAMIRPNGSCPACEALGQVMKK